MDVDAAALAFFNRLSGELAIVLSEAPVPISPNLANLRAPPNATIERVSFTMEVRDAHGLRPLNVDEANRVVLRASRIRMYDARTPSRVIEHAAPDGQTFTVRDLTAVIEETERQSRGESRWFDGVDVHHVYYEGITLDDGGAWRVDWGS